jgi:hypothetical protein
MDHPNVVNENELDWGEQSHGEKFGYRRQSLNSATGGEKLGCNLYEVLSGAGPGHTTTISPTRRPSTSSTALARSGLANGRSRCRGVTSWRCRRESQERTKSRTPRTRHCANSASRPWSNPT